MPSFGYDYTNAGQICCYRSFEGKCNPARFVRCRNSFPPFFDERLAAAQEDLNKRISQITEQMPDGRDEQGRTLHIISVPDGVLLVWAFEARVSSSNDDQDIEQALGLQR